MNSVTGAIDLAYMIRRGEVEEREGLSLKQLFKTSESRKEDAFWCINNALCYVDGPLDNNNWQKAISIISKMESNIDEASDWWRDETVVGKKERNIVQLLLHFSDIEVNNRLLASRLRRAEDDGFSIPQDLIDKWTTSTSE
jgi:hypothetical protein